MAVALARIDRTRQAVARARAAGHVPRPMPAQASPIAAERSYAIRLRSLVDRAITDAYAPLLRELPGLVDRSRSERGDAAGWRIDGTNSGRSASAAVKVAATSARQGLAAPAIRGAASNAAGDASAHVQAQLGKQVREVLGIDLAADTRAKARTAAFVHENVKLITGIGPTLAADIERIILSGLTAGQLHETLALAIKSRMKVAIGRAELIAVDQLGKIVGQINAARQQDLGVTHFYWRSAEDERVRGNPDGLYPKATPSHFDRNGKRYAYADPPKGKKGERELPGTPIRCRCYPDPDLSTVLGEGPAAPAPRDPAAPDAPNRAPTVEEQEAEAERLRREVEAMLAEQAAPTPAPAPRQPQAEPVEPAIPERLPVAVARTPDAVEQAKVQAAAEESRALAAVKAHAAKPMATTMHPAVSIGTPTVIGDFVAPIDTKGMEDQLEKILGKRITIEEISHAYAPPPGFTAEIKMAFGDKEEGGAGIEIIYKDATGKVIGKMARDFYGDGVVSHSSLYLDKEYQGAKFGETLNGQALLRYQGWGIKQIDVSAADVGRYAWARLGFSITEPGFVKQAEAYIDAHVPAEEREAYKAKVRLLAAEPWKLAKWDEGKAYPVAPSEHVKAGEHPIGKAILLDADTEVWAGEMKIDDDNPGYRNALRLLHVEDKS